MRTVRRLYFYAVAFVSLEVTLWGLIGLARSIFCRGNAACGIAAVLSQGLALILVGLPVFGFHWWMAQRSAGQDGDERASGVRAVFLYGVLLGTLIPIVQNVLALLDRLALQAVNLPPSQAMLGPNQTWTDNLVAILMNAIVAAYFISILRADWQAVTSKETLSDIRRLYRHIWLIYSLVMLVAAVQQLLRFILNISPNTFGFLYRLSGAHGVVLALIGVPLWYFSWKTILDALAEQAERESSLRLGVLYLLSLAGVIAVLASGGFVLNVVLRAAFGEQMTVIDFVQKIAGPLSIGIPLAGVWAYYGRWLTSAIDSVDIPRGDFRVDDKIWTRTRATLGSPYSPRRAGMRRIYTYILSAVGLAATFIGLSMLLSFVVDAAIGKIVWADVLRPRLTASLATLLVGFPLWGLVWRPVQAEALSAGDPGDHARRSIIRKVYLYLALFIGVVGGMIAAVSLLNIVLRALFGNVVDNLLQQVLKEIELLFLFVGLGTYHGLMLGKDGKLASRALAEKHAVFPVLVFDSDDGSFGQAILTALHKQTPRLPVTIQPISRPVANESMPRAIILPSDLALDPPVSLRRWLGRYNGNRLVVPRAAQSWLYAGGVRPLPAAAAQAALTIRQLAEGQGVRQQAATSGWMIAIYIIAGLFGLEILGALISLGISLAGD